MNKPWIKFGVPLAILAFGLAFAAVMMFRENGDPNFYATAEPGTLAIFVSSSRALTCTSAVEFSYLDDAGARQTGRHICQNYTRSAGEDVEVCRVTAPELIEPRVEGPVEATCQ